MKHVILSILILIIFPFTGYGEMYKWVDEKGTLHFTDDLSNIPEKYRQGAETRNPLLPNHSISITLDSLMI
jgi:hypothetical protein